MVMAAVTDIKSLRRVEATASGDLAVDVVHPYRGWIWVGAFTAGAGWWAAVGLGLYSFLE
jgi:hypothetical protein